MSLRSLMFLAAAVAALPAAAAPDTRASLNRALGEHFARADADGDGAISRAELNRAANNPPPELARMSRDQRQLLGAFWFARADADGDGRVTLAESRGLAGRMFAAADTNRDGKISDAERKRAEAMMKRPAVAR